MKTLIEKYIASKENAWAPSTKVSEKHRLNSVSHLLDGNPDRLWNGISAQAPYSRVTTWTRVVDFYDWCIQEGLETKNAYYIWRKANRRVFKDAYQPKQPKLSFEEAKARIRRLENESDRDKALQLLMGGLRYTESFTLQDATVLGKGSKRRNVFVEAVDYERCYQTFRRALKGVGLKPHELRKLAATQLARNGLREADLCAVMGWSSFATAKAYIAPVRDEELKKAFQKLK